MKETTITVLMFTFLACQVLHIFGKVIVLRGAPESNSQLRTLICLSEDDGSALVWNHLIWNAESVKPNILAFSKNAFNNNKIDCKMNDSEGCLKLWSSKNWTITNSFATPMALVFDQRWEEFKEYEFSSQYEHVGSIQTSAVLSFSIRAQTDLHILFCKDKYYKENLCYWVIIGGWGNTRSAIRKCSQGLDFLKDTRRSWPVPPCADILSQINHTPLSASEWRSFVITLNSVTRNITVYDTDNMIMTYVDKEELKKNRTIERLDYQVFIRSTDKMLFRFHQYNFLHTTTTGANLTSPILKVNSTTVCIQMFIGLCAECDAQVFLRDSTSNEVLEMVTAKGSLKPAIHGLPTWQSVKIKKNLTSTSSLVVQVIPELSTITSNPLWAIANVRQCPSTVSWRVNSVVTNQDLVEQDNLKDSLTCQKLFYNEHTVVNAIHFAKEGVALDDENCENGKLGPQCLFFCTYYMFGSADCNENAICYKNGCTCLPGFLGPKCSNPCGPNKYGHNCKKSCGSCRKINPMSTISSVESNLCDKTTGACLKGCKVENEKLYIRPLCKTAIDASVLPVINYRSTTNIRATVPITWKDEYKEDEIKYIFYIIEKQQLNEQNCRNISCYYSEWSNILPNTTYVIGNFENLKSNTEYKVCYVIRVGDLSVRSNWQEAETDCNPTRDFNVTTEETSLMINWRIDKQQLYPCPANKYHLIVNRVDKLEQIVNETATSFPYKVSSLTSHTLYNVTIFYKDQTLFFKEIHTLEGVPSEVLDLHTTLLSNNNITLTWRAPKEPNGNITQYHIMLKIQEYYGCMDVGEFESSNHTIEKWTTNKTITISNLQPYANYRAQVTAHNSRHGGTSREITFETKESEIPTETFGPLTLSTKLILSWSKPEDCKTISGRLKARIKIDGVSDAVKNFSFVSQAQPSQDQLNYFDLKKISELYGAEQYMVRVYVVRDENSSENASAYQKRLFTLPPTAPPPITNLDVVEIDTRHRREIIHLRWKSPVPPTNGKLSHYVIRICDLLYLSCFNHYKVNVNNTCDLWDDYICATIDSTHLEIQILAYNINVTESSVPVYVTETMLHNTTPDAPGNFTLTVKNNSVIDVKWDHPWKTGRHLQYFLIQIHKVSSNLTKNISIVSDKKVLKNYARYYKQELYLFPSTLYNIQIQAVTIANKSSSTNTKILQTPTTIDFDGNLMADVKKFDSTISLKIPPVLNDTQHSRIHIIVKGPKEPCKHLEVPPILRTQIKIKIDESAWQAAEGSISEFANQEFIVGNNNTYGNATNCPLKPEGSYNITVVLIEGNLTVIRTAFTILKREDTTNLDNPVDSVDPSMRHEVWFIPIICLILVGAIFYFYQRRKQQLDKQVMPQDEIILSQNIENYEHETSVISTSKQESSTPSDRQSLSRAATPEMSLIAIESSEEKKETASLIKVKDFEDYVRQAIQSGLLDKQYETFPRGQTQPWDYGKLPENKSKNRYGNLIAYDKTRVILNKLPDDAYSDYINANYITGYKKKKHYIATQGPKPNTVIDFWRMIWQERVLIICMLANVIENGKTKCEQYWPDIGKKKKYGDVIVLNAKHNVFADYCFRIFQVTCGDETRKIEHLHYTAWPDHGVPLYTHSVVTYLKKLLATPPGNGPVVVHCSAGIGRTGTIILCDICLRRAAAEGFVDVFAETASIRSERANMVDNKQQYLLAHLALVECLLSIPTALPCNMLPTRINELKKQLLVQQQRLQNTAWQNEALRQVTVSYPLSERNRAKNRFPELISDKVSRVYLKRYPTSDEDSDYLSAVYVDGVKLQNQYIATQLPMPSTINDFWRMIAEFKVELILMLQPPDLQDPTCCAIVPMSDEFTPTPYLNITTKDTVELEYYTSKKLLLVDNSETITFRVAETSERTICHYIVFNGVETWKGSTTAISYVDGNFLASHGKNRKRRWTYCHALP
ncbi:receptor-type tyrosine-protein phosphatase S-like isoform X2 [Linepithema humile]|uniref:receptor-type tyrosine-protein phosphatase S-like isoform X2 n=1 Tax=Linepithema humile TaxID=83485 RepID=UPI00351E5ABC